MAFHNPYTFIPVEKRTDDDRARDLALNNGQPTDWRHHGHDRYHATIGNSTAKVYSGRIQCTLKTVTPTLVGAKQISHETEDLPSEVEGYKRDGAPAIPASSLKGLFSSLAEAATASSLRVLDTDRVISEANSTLGDFFHQIDPQYLPFHSKRKRITPAELMFGFVRDEQSEPANPSAKHMAFRGKIVFEDALPNQPVPAGGWYLPQLTLPILASPKPSCPPMYFRIRINGHEYADTHIAKSRLKPGECIPKGRKVYLHHNRDLFRKDQEQAREYLQTRNHAPDQQHMKVHPIKAGVEFEFSIRFDNLNEWELGCLLYVLKPTATYNHKVGLGKPVGMGSVDIAITQVELVDRRGKYSWAGWQSDVFGKILASATRDQITNDFQKTITKRTRIMLEAVGEPGRVPNRVMYPRAQNQLDNQGMPNTEDELFRWFVNNDDMQQHLPQALSTDLSYKQMPSLTPNAPTHLQHR